MMREIKAVLFGATGVIGRGVLWECLEHPAVESVLVIGRRSCEVTHPKLTEALHDDFSDLSPLAEQMRDRNACYYCLGVSSVGKTEEQYSQITYDYTVAAVEAMAQASDEVTFCFISGMGSDDTMQSRTMWARVKGKAENAVRGRGFRQAFVLRPGFVQPVKKVGSVRLLYKLILPLVPLVKLLSPRMVTTTENVGRAMIQLTLAGNTTQVLENADINRVAEKLKRGSE